MIIKSYEILKNILKFLDYNLFLFHGENEGLKKDIVENIKAETIKKNKNVEFISLYESDILNKEEKFYSSVYSQSLFSNEKIIIIKDAKDKIIKPIKEVLDKYPENIKIIFISDILEKKSILRNLFETNIKTIAVACYPDSEKDLEIIANIEFKKNKIILSRETINLLIEKSNYDRNNLKNEIEKIKSFTLDKKKLEVDEIKSLINFSGEHKSDSFINECLCGNILQYKKILSEFYLNAINQIFLFRMFSKKIQRLLIMKEIEKDHKNLDNLIHSSKPPIFWKEKPMVKKQLKIWKQNDLKKTVYEINDIELLCKKNPQVSKIIFFNFFSKICTQANNFS